MKNPFFKVEYKEIDNIAGFIKYAKIIKILFFYIKFIRYKKDSFLDNKIFIGEKEIKHYNEIKDSFNGEIKINGNSNLLILPSSNVKGYIEINGDNNKCSIGKPKRESIVYIVFEKENKNRELIIGECELIGNVHFRIIDSNRKIIIGKNCLFSYGIYVWTTDSHEIYDLKTNKRINYDKDVIIGDNVWVGRNSSIQKGAVVPNGCIVGANSFVNKCFEQKNCIIAGAPAIIVKTNVRWEYGESV